MRMYVLLAVVALLLLIGCLTLAGLAWRSAMTARSERKREEVAARLAPLVEQAAEEQQARTTAAQVSSELTAVLPVIRPDDGQQPRRVA
jgi:Tfp pilus assembly protein PilV